VAKGIEPTKIEVIKNGVDLALFRRIEGPNAVSRELALEGKFVASYFGTHGMAHRLETVLYAARELRGYDDLVFLLVGDGAERDRLVAMRDEMQLTNVVMLGQQPKQRMPDLWDLSAVSLALLKKSELFKTVIPSKIFESLAMETPVILGVEGESAKIIEAAAAGFCIEPENSRELAARVLELYRDPELVARLGANGRRHVEEHYDRTQLARRYEALFASLLAGRAPVPAGSEN
jgi:glycosyltransferase involved in cell wall biosynthesis